MNLPSSQYAPVKAGCKCRRVPLWVVIPARVRFQTLNVPPDFPVLAHPCRSCGKQIVITAGDLGIAKQVA